MELPSTLKCIGMHSHVGPTTACLDVEVSLASTVALHCGYTGLLYNSTIPRRANLQHRRDSSRVQVEPSPLLMSTSSFSQQRGSPPAETAADVSFPSHLNKPSSAATADLSIRPRPLSQHAGRPCPEQWRPHHGNDLHGHDVRRMEMVDSCPCEFPNCRAFVHANFTPERGGT